jgi:hypothetical protein
LLLGALFVFGALQGIGQEAGGQRHVAIHQVDQRSPGMLKPQLRADAAAGRVGRGAVGTASIAPLHRDGGRGLLRAVRCAADG